MNVYLYYRFGFGSLGGKQDVAVATYTDNGRINSNTWKSIERDITIPEALMLDTLISLQIIKGTVNRDIFKP